MMRAEDSENNLVLMVSGPFPLIISVRQVSDSILVFDDLLRLTPCHLNAIPTSCYCPDWRYLLLKPREGTPNLRSQPPFSVFLLPANSMPS
jgi:hypothetical protein